MLQSLKLVQISKTLNNKHNESSFNIYVVFGSNFNPFTVQFLRNKQEIDTPVCFMKDIQSFALMWLSVIFLSADRANCYKILLNLAFYHLLFLLNYFKWQKLMRHLKLGKNPIETLDSYIKLRCLPLNNSANFSTSFHYFKGYNWFAGFKIAVRQCGYLISEQVW